MKKYQLAANAVLSGTVSDSSGALIPGVEVTAKNVNTGIADTRLTNESGQLRVSQFATWNPSSGEPENLVPAVQVCPAGGFLP
jgi:hypothetical protein